MKPKEYINKYGLNNPNQKFDHGLFVNDLEEDFKSIIKNQKEKNQWTYVHFTNSINMIREKWDGIVNKSVTDLKENLWNYFYATVIVKIREDEFGEYLKTKEKEWKERNAWRNHWEENSFDFGYEFLKNILYLSSIPNESFQFFSLPITCSIEEIKKKFFELSKLYHPDHGGNSEMFIQLVDHKNRCITYLGNKNV